jgi:short-subunit dehydrogenase
MVIGASSGIGEAVARQLVEQGARVAMVARRVDRMNTIAHELSSRVEGAEPLVYGCDVRDVDHSQTLFAEIVGDLGGLDLAVYASGVMPTGARDGFPTAEDVSALETNLTGAVVWLNAAADHMVHHRGGTIVGIGSIAGDRGRRDNIVYNATKAGLAVYLEGLRNRLAREGIAVLTVKPGLVRTDMIGDRTVFPPACSSRQAAAQIIEAAREGHRVIYVPGWWRLIAMVLKAVPAAVMERLPV